MTQNTLSRASSLRGRWLRLARLVWVVVALVNLTLFIVSVPAYWAQLSTICTDSSEASCELSQLNPVKLQALEGLGATIGAYAIYTLTIHAIASLAFFVVGALIFWRRSNDWYGLFVSFLLISLGASGPSSVFTNAFAWAYPDVASRLDPPAWLLFPALGLFLVTFPDGRFVPRWSWLIVLLWLAQAVFWDVIYSWPLPLFVAELSLVWGSTLAVQVYRYRRVADVTQRQQTKWVLFGFAIGVSTILTVGLSTVVFPHLNAPDSRFWLLEGTWVALLFTSIPLSIGIALVRYRLWDIDPIINRTVVFGALTASVVGIYVLIVGYLGALLQTGSNLFVSLLATGLVAVLFAPLRDRLQRTVNRLMYGERDDPYAVVSRLGERLEATLAPEAVLPTIVQSVKEALKLPYAAIALTGNGAAPPRVAASVGEPVEKPLQLPLTYQSERAGALLLGPRAPGETFAPADRRLLEGLARQAGVAAYAVRLTADLQRSRERLVAAREEERRRLRRDLHDGLGAQLAGLIVETSTVRRLIPHDPAAADDLVVELREELRSAIADIRRLVYDLRPPALDDLGLATALHQLAERYGAEGEQLRVSVEAPE
ncbi:MAG TPA: histidine kinase dimerization/phosphoacceptor domain-containing protein, partial [Herpetosiphonaceae bacterium]|nr:histidine kinase dimerization/phosphoacceptor domain-containing protein [Herpetosiphonaceae bacterium]